MKKKRILVPLDDTTFSLRVLPHVTELFTPRECEVYLLHVETLPSAVTVDEHVVIYADQVTATKQAEGYAALQPYVRGLEEFGFEVTSVIRFGDPVDQIIHIAKEMQIDLIAMTTHARAGFDRVLHGSVAQAVMAQVDLPVLLYHAEPKYNRQKSQAY